MKPTPAERDAYIAEKILMYCDQIKETVSRFGAEKSVFLSDPIYRNAVSLCVIQIGELSLHLTQEFRMERSKISWRGIREMRNTVVHGYDTLEPNEIWRIITEDLPNLEACLKETDKRESANDSTV